MAGKMEEISGYLKIVDDRLKHVSQLSPPEFQRSLPEVKATLVIAKTERVEPTPETIAGIRSNFGSSDSNAPDFWGAATAMINLRSTGVPVTGRMCVNDRVAWTPQGSVWQSIEFHECTLVIDDGTAFAAFLKKYNRPDTPLGFVLTRVRVVYHGGPLIPKAFSFEFINCSFDFSLAQPDPVIGPGRTLIKKMIAVADLPNAKIEVSG
jgi:hypothetical protein